MSQRASMERILAQREKQIGIAKMTRGYQNYVRHVRKCDRNPRDPSHPSTPRVDGTDSKRAFEGRLRIWKQALHKWDTRDGQPPAQHEASTSSQSQGRQQAQWDDWGGDWGWRKRSRPWSSNWDSSNDGWWSYDGSWSRSRSQWTDSSWRDSWRGGWGNTQEHWEDGTTTDEARASCAGSKSADATPSHLYVSDEEPIEAWMQQGVEEGRWTIVRYADETWLDDADACIGEERIKRLNSTGVPRKKRKRF